MNGRPWTPDEDEILRRDYPDCRAEDLAERLGRGLQSIYRRARQLGVKKSEAFYRSPAANRLDGVRGAHTRFVPGQRPWNAGMKGFDAGGRSHETRFQKGQRGNKWVPIGTARYSKDGYLQVKIQDTGYPPADWEFLHRLVYEHYVGPVPCGHIVRFRDGDKRNFALENLECISLQENARRNSIHRYPPELRDAMRTLGQLKKRIRDHEKQD